MSSHRPAVQVISPVAVDALRSADPVLREVIDRVGGFEPSHEPDLWWSLVGSICSQQLSVKAAATILGRVEAIAPKGRRPMPQEILEAPDDLLRACGLSRAKTAYVKDLAVKWLDGTLEPERLESLSDEEVIEHLIRVKGIGRWTAEMVLMFTLRRSDVLPVDDLGLRVAVQEAYGLARRPGTEELMALGEAWRPWRSVASFYLWRSRRV